MAKKKRASRRKATKPKSSRPSFDYSLDYASLDLRTHPELYRVGKGEQGVLLVEPYKSEILPLWRFRDKATALKSSRALRARFLEYRDAGDFVGMDMARKFIQMGYTRARRYANHRSGRKYAKDGKVLPRVEDAKKAEAARVFKRVWDAVEKDPVYRARKLEHKTRYG